MTIHGADRVPPSPFPLGGRKAALSFTVLQISDTGEIERFSTGWCLDTAAWRKSNRGEVGKARGPFSWRIYLSKKVSKTEIYVYQRIRLTHCLI